MFRSADFRVEVQQKMRTGMHQTKTMRRPTFLLLLLAPACQARRGAIVKDGMTSKRAYDNPGLQSGVGITLDPDVVAITSRCSRWEIDPIDCISSSENTLKDSEKEVVNDVLSKEMRSLPLHITFRVKTLAGGKRNNWMRTSASLGADPALKSNILAPTKSIPLRAVWTCSNADADASMTYEEQNEKSGKNVRKEVGNNVLEDSYEDCLKRVYGKYVELEVLLPKTKGMMKQRAAAPPSVVYRVPIQSGHVNPLGMTSKSRATVTLYPKGRTLAASNASGPGAANIPRDVGIPLGLANVHLPLGPGLVDPGWVKGRKLFWKGGSVGVV